MSNRNAPYYRDYNGRKQVIYNNIILYFIYILYYYCIIKLFYLFIYLSFIHLFIYSFLILSINFKCLLRPLQASHFQKSFQSHQNIYQRYIPSPPLSLSLSLPSPSPLPLPPLLFLQPMVPYTVYCFNANDLLWVLYPAINEPLVTPARIYTTALNLLFVFTFQVPSLSLFLSLSSFFVEGERRGGEKG